MNIYTKLFEKIPGSPFTIRIAGAPDASKVRVYGPGIEPGVLATYQSRFICDTRGAGAGQLTVRIRGPKGSYNFVLVNRRILILLKRKINFKTIPLKAVVKI